MLHNDHILLYSTTGINYNAICNFMIMIFGLLERCICRPCTCSQIGHEELQYFKLIGTSKMLTVPDAQASPRRLKLWKERSWRIFCSLGCRLLKPKRAWDAGIRGDGRMQCQPSANFIVNSCGPRRPVEPEPVPHRKKRRSRGLQSHFQPKNNRIFNRMGRMNTQLTIWCRMIEQQTCFSVSSSNINDFKLGYVAASLFSILGAVSQERNVRTSCD